jgi:hypothetical protein
MNLKANLFLLFIITLCTLSVKSQNDFKAGFVVNNSNDTIIGLIAWKRNAANSMVCKFKMDENSNLITYEPKDIKCYGIDNQKLYISKVVDIENNIDTLFLEYLVSGIVDLYYLKRPRKELYFIEKDGKLFELTNDEKSFIDKNGVQYIGNSNKYRGALKYLLSDSPELAAQISQTSFSLKSLIRITVNYHKQVCDEYLCIDYTKPMNNSLFIEPCFGAKYSKLAIKDMDGTAYDLMPLFGANFSYQPKLLKDSWKLVAGVKYYKSYYESIFSEEYLSRVIDRNYFIEYHSLNVPIYIEYNITRKTGIFYIASGINNMFAIHSQDDIRRTHSGVNEEPFDYRTFNIGIIVGVGSKFELANKNYVNCFLAYDVYTPLTRSGYVLDKHSVSSLQLNIGYAFKIK